MFSTDLVTKKMLSNLRLRVKLLLLALGPILLLAMLFSGLAVHELRSLAEQQEQQTRQSLINDRRAELQHYVQLACNALKPIYDASADGDLEARDRGSGRSRATVLWQRRLFLGL